MQSPTPVKRDQVTIQPEHLQMLLDHLTQKGFHVVGPTIRDGAIVLDEITSTASLPIGWTDEQSGGSYRLKKKAGGAYFGYTLGPQSWKQFLHPPFVQLFHATRKNGLTMISERPEVPRYAFFGVRPCDLRAIGIDDRVFLGGDFHNPEYRTRREGAFIVAVNCSRASKNCFCTSVGGSPRADTGFDLALTEVFENGRHYFVVDIATQRGHEFMKDIPQERATKTEIGASQAVTSKAASQINRSLNTTDIKEMFYRNYENPRWDDVAGRCMSCANCTMVCPTCFCTSVDDVTDLAGENAERWQRWDSCMNVDFSYIHGGSVRATVSSRYRQWITHKLAAWEDQFGTLGCVGCGRCITWCPVGIDITEEAHAIRDSEPPG